jgi:hypothetical protein
MKLTLYVIASADEDGGADGYPSLYSGQAIRPPPSDALAAKQSPGWRGDCFEAVDEYIATAPRNDILTPFSPNAIALR